MSASEKRLADFILGNSALIRDYSSQQLASSVGVSQSSVVKFSQKLGYKGFTDLKLAIHETVVRQESGGSSIPDGAKAGADAETVAARILRDKYSVLSSTGDLNGEKVVDAVVEKIESSRRVHVIAGGTASLIGRDFAFKLTVLGYPVSSESESQAQLCATATLGKEDVLLVISASGHARDLIHMTRLAKKSGTTIVSLTSFNTNPIVALSDLRLYSVAHNGQPDIPQILETASQQHVIDLLFYRLVERDSHGREKLIRNRKALDELTSTG